jgi:hypothetical protein
LFDAAQPVEILPARETFKAARFGHYVPCAVALKTKKLRPRLDGTSFAAIRYLASTSHNVAAEGIAAGSKIAAAACKKITCDLTQTNQ